MRRVGEVPTNVVVTPACWAPRLQAQRERSREPGISSNILGMSTADYVVRRVNSVFL